MSSGAQPKSRIEGADAALSLYHLLDRQVLADPYPLFRRLREEDPVHWDPFLHAWVVTRYSDVVEVLHTYSANRTPTPEQLASMGLSHLSPIAGLMVQQMLFMEASQHTRLRGLASRAFTPARIDTLRSHIVEIVNRLLDEFESRGSMDAIADLGEPLPAIITAEMLGVPVEDRMKLKQWSANFAEMLGNFQHNPEHAQTMLRTVEDMTAYFREAVRETKKYPREGLIHSLLNAEIGGDRLSEEEIVANVIITMVGGQETTTNLIGNGVLTLLRHPDQLEKLRADLSLIPSAVEEMLRFESPSQHTARLAPEDSELGGKKIRKRQAVIAVMAAANRDPERFPDPDRFDVGRADNRHVAFGYAAHFCFGAPLARLEGQVVFETLLRRFPKFHLEPQELVWRTNLGLRGLTSLKIALEGPETKGKPFSAQRDLSAGGVASGDVIKAGSGKLLSDWNDTAKPYPAHLCIHEVIEGTVARTPDALAIEDKAQRITYRELNAGANRLARFLRGKGVGAEVPVAICLKRSADLLVAVLAVLKAGGACVPLDPDYPSERLAHILRDSKAPVLITQADLLAELNSTIGGSGAEILTLGSLAGRLEEESGENLNCLTTPENLAYIIYTSGSTGTPRGVLLTHGGLVNHGFASIEVYGLTAAERMLQFASISFDIAIEEIFPTWFAGGCVIPRGDDVPLTAVGFLRWLEKNKITAIDVPTAYWHELVHELSESEEALPESLRLLIVGGEKASSSAYSSWLKAGGARVRWVNTYGPTEACVIASSYEPDPKKPFPDNLPIGRPIANVQLHVLDSELRPVPVGEAGELHIGGAGLARGYLNHPERTAAKFIGDPFSKDANARLYKTGDMVRRLPDGNIEFIGRIDFQVKIRGFRVELGEIESVLEKHPDVAQAVVIARESQAGKQLAAYVIASSGRATAGELRDYVKKQLPEYMAPANFVFMESFPVTPNGKVDRKALPEPQIEAAVGVEAGVAPSTEAEKKMARLWAQVLGRGAIGLRDNFFDLGGHSLLALRLTSRIEKEFGRKLTLTALLQAPTIEQLLPLIQSGESWSPLVPLQRAGARPAFFFVHGLGGTVMRFHALARHIEKDQPFICFQAQGLDGKQPVLDQVEAMADLYCEHLLKAQPEGPYYLGGYSFGGLVALEMARRLAEGGHEIRLLALVDTYFVGQQGNSSLVGRFLSLSPEQKLVYLKKRAVRYGRGIKRRMDALSLPAPVKAVREACAVAEQKYRPSMYPGAITLFRASEKALRGLDNGQNGWNRYAAGGVEIHEIDGDHGNILNEPNVRQLAAALCERLERAQNEPAMAAR
ncbi:MAG TPA: amino acid adenylation domain-containing protein [Candidatus Binatia bacterium]|nr:amino acid adenylation domain-containing protein [Candidatus Binatia bacterium]